MSATATHHFTHVIKRDQRIVDFDTDRIVTAIAKAMTSTREGDLQKDPVELAEKTMQLLVERHPRLRKPSIEQIQDAVEEVLIVSDFHKTAKAYIIYRNERSHVRTKEHAIPAHLKDIASKSKKYFSNTLSEFVYYRSYSRWQPEKNRRETWIESVDRYMSFMKENVGDKLPKKDYDDIREAILAQEIMPSMRLMWSAGDAARATNVCGYNCSYIAPEKLEDFAEIMYISMCGTGVGFSVENHITQRLPIIEKQTGEKLKTHVVDDSKEGWCSALTHGLKTWYGGSDVEFDYSQVRPAGAVLKTMGGRSSGPEPLRSLMNFTRNKIVDNQGRRLHSIDVHDIICKIGEIVVAGGVRRSALISLSDLDDIPMREAKHGQFYLTEPQRSMANNSAVYNEKPTSTEFMREWIALAESGSGERGIFNRGGLKAQLPERRWKKMQGHVDTTGTNPCGEIILRSKQFCNLTEIVAKSYDTAESLVEKMRLATILGTYQSTLTDFKFLSQEWKKNCEEERLLGVSITGQWDSRAVRDPKVLNTLREESITVNKSYAKKLGINQSTCITCVKPSGTVSQLVDSSSGMHPRYANYYIRRIRISATDPLFHMIRDQKYPGVPEVGQSEDDANTFVLEFPVKAPKNAVVRSQMAAADQLKHWKMVKENFTEHNPSVTVYVKDGEWLNVANWLYDNWEMIGGVSFLPDENHVYQLAPYEEISKEQYEKMVKDLPAIDFSHILAYEKVDHTQGSKELACVGGTCEISPDELFESVGADEHSGSK